MYIELMNQQIEQPDTHLNKFATYMPRFTSLHLWTLLLFGFEDLGLSKPGQSSLPILVNLYRQESS